MKTDVVIVGGGPAGATAALYLAREGIRSVIVEKETFPRFHIGESMTGEAGKIVADLGLKPEMLKREHPIKYGVNVYGEGGRNSWWVPVMARDAQNELQDAFTWQVRRSDFDQMLLEQALAQGAELVQGQAVSPVVDDSGAVCGVNVRTSSGDTLKIEAEMVLDCSGAATFLANAGITGPKYRGSYDRQMAIYSHFEGALRDDGDTRETYKDNTLIFYKEKYHWGWFIPIDKDVVSLGITAPAQHYLSKKQSKMDYLLDELRNLNPALSWRTENLKPTEDARATVNYSYQIQKFAGPGYICIGDAHRFIDPIFSFGLYVSMKEAQFAAKVTKDYLAGLGRGEANPFAEYMIKTEKGIDVLEDALDAFWEFPLAFAAFVHYRYKPEMIDVFAGRIYNEQMNKAAEAFRSVLKRDRTYSEDGSFSVPIGSRYNPEQDSVWQAPSIEM